MTLSSEAMIKLMAYADGELDEAERREVERLLATNPEASRFVDQIADLGSLVAAGHDDARGKAIASFDVADAVMDKLASPSPVVDLAERRATRMKLAGGFAAALAIAASVFLFIQHRDSESPMAKGPTQPAFQTALGVPAPNSSGSGATAVAAASPPSAGGGPGVDVRTVESVENSVSVFYLPSANDLSTSVVVWVDEKTGEK